MAYTIQRLQQARRLFLGVKSFHYEDFDNWIRTRYSLRKRTTQVQNIYSTWIDNDNTDDYNPRADRVASKRKRQSRADSGSQRPAKRVREPSSLIVTMSFKTEAGKSFLSSLPIYQNDENDKVNEWESYWSISDMIDAESASDSRYALRKREKQTDGSSADIELGHPAARGCKSCWELSGECSLLDSPLNYPCDYCREDDIECELIIPPKWKRTCENCKRIRKACSYNQEKTDYSLPCLLCQQHGVNCVAGPARYAPEESDNSISHAIAAEVEPVQSIEPVESTQTLLAEPLADAPVLAAEAVETKQSKNTASFGLTRVIQTSYAHPINFAYEPPDDGTDPCDWCDTFLYGLVGLGRRTVEVIDMGKGQYYEILGGHTNQGHKSSRMCVTCALERIHITRCASHQLIPLQGYDVDSFDFDAAYGSLVPVPGEKAKMINPWCSLCPNPAFYGCGTVQSVNKYQEPVQPSSSEAMGCGLLLCEKCELLMRCCSRNLAQVVARTQKEDEEFGCRSDVGFLLPGNDLYRFYTGT